ncbi:MAG TPA: acylphosphatase [Thermoflexia bacterium]|jgi:acylphosphatase|nr:acylphosphatase [Thermoflexia bacterium]
MDGNPEERARLHAVVEGRVQGVNFRYYTVRTARRLGLTGWVANRWDGTVETVAEGPRAALEAFLDFLHEGSPAARVTRVNARWERPTGEFTDFTVRYL